ncbi:MAG: hypothetical protein A2V86_13150 [Deltaproteobacteria bacterium RBG_16_49_23]|nr:MAG: hypothetical protein A2V86_13150 [Deltaproteobacteria bacterium RBG_16_49_23]
MELGFLKTLVIIFVVIFGPDPGFVFNRGDVVYLIGKRENVLKAIELFESSSRDGLSFKGENGI